MASALCMPVTRRGGGGRGAGVGGSASRAQSPAPACPRAARYDLHGRIRHALYAHRHDLSSCAVKRLLSIPPGVQSARQPIGSSRRPANQTSAAHTCSSTEHAAYRSRHVPLYNGVITYRFCSAPLMSTQIYIRRHRVVFGRAE